jgi:glyoxylase-like metal-dependent hydrolase (beta-lactamase superfamily II)
MPDRPEHATEELTSDVMRLRIAFVNLYFVGPPRGSHGITWTLVDTGLSTGAARILQIAAERYGQDARPTAIVLTHGHFDHVGALEPLVGVWDVPVYAHPLELPFLTGRANYPPPDPTVGNGVMARVAPKFPEKGVNLGDRVRALPSNGDVPGMPGWNWIHTPGHSPGHISLFRVSDRVLIAGDAVTTTRQESVFSVVAQTQELHGPPAVFTIDWERGRHSVATIASLNPRIVATGHGEPMHGDQMADHLARLAHDFNHRARPRRGRYVLQPAVTDETGVVFVPPALDRGGVPWGVVSGVAAAAVAGTWLVRRFGRRAKEAAAQMHPGDGKDVVE